MRIIRSQVILRPSADRRDYKGDMSSGAATPPVKPPLKEGEVKGEPVSIAGRRALITTVIAIALNPISLVAGYYINHSLQAPKLGIQNVTPSYTVADQTLGEEGLHALAESPRLGSVLRQTLSERSPGANTAQPICTEWLSGKAWNDDCRALVLDAFAAIQQQLTFDINALSRNIQLIEEWKQGSPLILEPVNTPDDQIMRLMESIQGMQFDPKRSVGQIKYYVSQEKKGLQALRRLSKAFDDMVNAPFVNTGDLAFNVGVLNSGDSDGVVFDSGTVTIDGTELPLNADNYTVVKAHSFESISFRVWYGQDSAHLKIRDLVKRQGSDVPFRVSIRTGKTTSARADGTLPKRED